MMLFMELMKILLIKGCTGDGIGMILVVVL